MIGDMKSFLGKLLDYLNGIIDPVRQAQIDELYENALSWKPVKRLPLVISFPVSEDMPFKPFPHREIFEDPAKMLYNELVHTWGLSIVSREHLRDDLPLTIRANYGTVIVASIFGGRIEQVDDNPPWVRHFVTLAEFKRAMERDLSDFSRGWCPRVVERYDYYRETLREYPILQKSIRLPLPDLQGPLDTVELLRGSEVFLDLYKTPEMVADALHKAAMAQIGLARHLASYVSDGPRGFSHQHGIMISGNILIRNDTAIMVSPEMYRSQIAPYDALILEELGGGGMHACGNLQNQCPEFLSLPSMKCLDFGQSYLNEIDAVYEQAKEKSIALLRIQVPEKELTTGRVMERFPTGVTLLHEAKSLDDAGRIMEQYREACA